MPRIANVPAYVRVATQIKEAIAKGQLKAGDRIGGDAHMAELGVSRSTIREAIRLLESEKLVVTMRGVKGGTFITTSSVADMGDGIRTSLQRLASADRANVPFLLETRHALEVPAVRYAAQRRTAEDLEELAAAIPKSGKFEAGEAFSCSWQFHSAILEAAHNPVLKEFAESISSVIRVQSALESQPVRRFQFMYADHMRIYRYISNQEAELAAAEMAAHLTRVGEVWTEKADSPGRGQRRRSRTEMTRT